MFIRRLGSDPHANGRQTPGVYGCPDILELDGGDFAVIGADITPEAIAKLPPGVSCGPDERIVRIPRLTLVGAKQDIPDLVWFRRSAGVALGLLLKSRVMGFSSWMTGNWFILLQSVGIIASLFFTACSLRSETVTRRVANLLTITESHRELWTEFYQRPELKRVLDERVDVHQGGITREEEIFVNFVIFHLNAVFYAWKSGLVFKLEGLRRDVRWFFALPIPQIIWEGTKLLQNDEFVAFVESCRKLK
jgi:hypothetical protein